MTLASPGHGRAFATHFQTKMSGEFKQGALSLTQN